MLSRVTTPTLAKFARMGHPVFRYWEKEIKSGERLGHPPSNVVPKEFERLTTTPGTDGTFPVLIETKNPGNVPSVS